MRKITFSEATREAMAEELEKYPEVFVMGEDLARQGGIFGQFKGLPDEFPGRVIDTPISETFIVGGGVGAALGGARPVVDMHFADFIGVCMDEVLNQMAKIHYMFGGQAKIPLVLRAPDGLAGGGAAQHSQSVESFFIHIPGIKVVAPSNPYDAKMVLKAAIETETVLELNTRRFGEKLAIKELVPVYSRYRELGGRRVTLGSDAHTADDIGAHFAAAWDFAEALGLQVVTFCGRMPEPCQK